jgi:hypothetical protein
MRKLTIATLIALAGCKQSEEVCLGKVISTKLIVDPTWNGIDQLEIVAEKGTAYAARFPRFIPTNSIAHYRAAGIQTSTVRFTKATEQP